MVLSRENECYRYRFAVGFATLESVDVDSPTSNVYWTKRFVRLNLIKLYYVFAVRKALGTGFLMHP